MMNIEIYCRPAHKVAVILIHFWFLPFITQRNGVKENKFARVYDAERKMCVSLVMHRLLIKLQFSKGKKAEIGKMSKKVERKRLLIWNQRPQRSSHRVIVEDCEYQKRGEFHLVTTGRIAGIYGSHISSQFFLVFLDFPTTHSQASIDLLYVKLDQSLSPIRGAIHSSPSMVVAYVSKQFRRPVVSASRQLFVTFLVSQYGAKPHLAIIRRAISASFDASASAVCGQPLPTDGQLAAVPDAAGSPRSDLAAPLDPWPRALCLSPPWVFVTSPSHPILFSATILFISDIALSASLRFALRESIRPHRSCTDLKHDAIYAQAQIHLRNDLPLFVQIH